MCEICSGAPVAALARIGSADRFDRLAGAIARVGRVVAARGGGHAAELGDLVFGAALFGAVLQAGRESKRAFLEALSQEFFHLPQLVGRGRAVYEPGRGQTQIAVWHERAR